MDEFVYERKKMNKKLRKTIRLTAISLGALLTVFLVGRNHRGEFYFYTGKVDAGGVECSQSVIECPFADEKRGTDLLFHLSSIRTEGDGWSIGVQSH